MYSSDWSYYVIRLMTSRVTCADRTRWSSYDVFYFSEVCLALASVMTICRLTYILAFNTKTGVLVVSLSKMVVVSRSPGSRFKAMNEFSVAYSV